MPRRGARLAPGRGHPLRSLPSPSLVVGGNAVGEWGIEWERERPEWERESGFFFTKHFMLQSGGGTTSVREIFLGLFLFWKTL
jgi:hypothetical protein